MSMRRTISSLALCLALTIPASAQDGKDANLLVDVSGSLINRVLQKAVDRTEPVDDVIQETPVRGNGRTVGAITSELIPDARCGAIDVVFRGYNLSQTVGERSNVYIYTTTTTSLDVRRRVIFDSTGIRSSAGPARGDALITLLGITSRTWPEQPTLNFAKRVFEQSLNDAECESGRKTAWNLSHRIDRELTPTLASLSQSIGRELKTFKREEFKLDALDFRTTDKALQARLRFTAPKYPPRISGALPGDTDLGVRIHETIVNYDSDLELGGLAFRPDELPIIYRKATRGLVKDGRPGADPKALERVANLAAQTVGKKFIVTFAKKDALLITFADQGFRAEFRFATVKDDNQLYAGDQISATYRFENAADGVHAVRVGAIRVTPMEERDQAGKKLTPIPAKYALLRDIVFAEIFTERLTLVLPKMPEAIAAIRMHAPKAYARDGWLGLAWSMAPR